MHTFIQNAKFCIITTNNMWAKYLSSNLHQLVHLRRSVPCVVIQVYPSKRRRYRPSYVTYHKKESIHVHPSMIISFRQVIFVCFHVLPSSMSAMSYWWNTPLNTVPCETGIKHLRFLREKNTEHIKSRFPSQKKKQMVSPSSIVLVFSLPTPQY